jgi:Fe-Mn family superoxide dismutase
MEVRAQDLPFDAGALRSLSRRLLHSHHQNNYAGAVGSQLARLPFASAAAFQINGLEREQRSTS